MRVHMLGRECPPQLLWQRAAAVGSLIGNAYLAGTPDHQREMRHIQPGRSREHLGALVQKGPASAAVKGEPTQSCLCQALGPPNSAPSHNGGTCPKLANLSSIPSTPEGPTGSKI